MADQTVLRFPAALGTALATSGQVATLPKGTDGLDAGGASSTNAKRTTSIEAAGTLAGIDLLQECPSEPQVQQPAGHDSDLAAPNGERTGPQLVPLLRAFDRLPANAPQDSPPIQARSDQDRDDQDRFESRALDLARAFWTGSEPTRAAEATRAGAETPRAEAQTLLHSTDMADARRDPATGGDDPAFARTVAAGTPAARSRSGFGVAFGIVLAVCIGVAISFMPDRPNEIVASEKTGGEAAIPVAPPPSEMPAVAVLAALPPVEAPADPPRSQPAEASRIDVAVERATTEDVAPSRPAPPLLILADALPLLDAESVIHHPARPNSPPSVLDKAPPVGEPPPVQPKAVILRPASPSQAPAIKAAPPTLLAEPLDDGRGAGDVIVHPLLPPPVESAPPQDSASTLARDSRLDSPPSSPAVVEPAAILPASAVAAPLPDQPSGALADPSPAPAANRPRDAPVLAQAAPGAALAEPRPAIGPAQAAAMTRRADALAAIGDLSGARLFYERLALAGSREAALALARSYDPNWLRQHGVVGVPPDPARAAYWYERASAPTGNTPASQAPRAKP